VLFHILLRHPKNQRKTNHTIIRIRISKLHYGLIGAGYLFNSSLQEAYLERFVDHNYRGRLVEWIQDYEDAFTELALLGQKTWNDDEIKKHRFLQNAQNIGLVDTVLKK
jgi:hypothetical protein